MNTRPFAALLALTLALLTLSPTSSAIAQDQIGIYWDAAYTQDTLEVSQLPGVATGHIVLANPVATAGIIGWEFCVNVDGEILFLSWDLAGQAINLEAPPCFVVGLADPLPPVGNAILLASFECLVSQLPPVTFSVGPTPIPSVPGEMVYIPADQPNALVPLGTVTGTPEVAWINPNNPAPEFDVQSLDFGVQPTGLTSTKVFTVTNAGGGVLDIDLQLSAGCEGFTLPGVSGPVSLLPGESTTVHVAFAPLAVQPYACNVELGPFHPTVSLQGAGREPVFSYTLTSALRFGEVALGQSKTLSVALRNTGEVPLPVVPELLGCGAEFSIAAGAEPDTVQPAGLKYINVRFSPTAEDTFSCALWLADNLDQVALSGTGADLLLSFDAPSAVDFGTTYVGGQVTKYVSIINDGEGAFSVTPSLLGCGEEFVLVSGEFQVTLYPGGSHTVGVRFLPSAVDSFACELLLGDIVDQVHLAGIGREPVLSYVSPTLLDYGTVQIGAFAERRARIYNNGEAAFDINPALVGCSGDMSIVSGGTPRTLASGQWVDVTTRFQPTTPDSLVCQLDLGATVPPVLLRGIGIEAVPSWTVTPENLNFLTTAEGDSRTETVQIVNTGLTVLDLDVQMVDETLGFSVESGGGPRLLPPQGALDIFVRFAPLVAGTFATELSLGTELPAVPVTGSAGEIIESCGVTPTSIDFGTTTIGVPQSRTVTVTNTGNQLLSVGPSTTSAYYDVEGSPKNLLPGETADYTVTFLPVLEGTWSGKITMGGSGVCSEVTCTGTAVYSGVAGDDLLGVFFDVGFSENTHVLPAGHFGEAFVVLYNPSDPTGVVVWELALNLIGDVIMLPLEFEGSGINIATEPDYLVFVADSPLPGTTAVLLASFRFLIMTPYSVVLVEVGPVTNPSIPGQMGWMPSGDSVIRPMTSFTGTSIVAEINTTSSVAVAAPTPALAANGGQVHLSWPAPTELRDGCHVYRRAEGEVAVRLTNTPLTSTAGTLQFTDQPTGFNPGTPLYYSYSIVTEGVEIARSPEVEFLLSSLPAVQTRLLPNVPNPFNPQTEIRFELGKSAQARVAIYDVTGRLVRTLENGHLEAGPYTRIWQGRDDSGRPVSSGAYYVRLSVEGKVDHRKIMLLK